MKVMLDLSPQRIAELSAKHDMEFWQLRTPLTRYRLAGVPYGLDNGAYSGFDYKAWRTLVDDARENRPLWITLPDIVGDARRTWELFHLYAGELEGLPKALVLQDGIENVEIPWKHIDAVFIGGTDSFKVSAPAINAAKAAKLLGKWVHVGRVNGVPRLKQWMGLADSIDGSGLCRFDHMLNAVVDFLKAPDRQGDLLAC